MIAINDNYGGTSATIEQEGLSVWYETLVLPEESTEEYVPPEQIFNTAILVSRESQTNRKTFKGVSGCPPIRRGRHWDRKLR